MYIDSVLTKVNKYVIWEVVGKHIYNENDMKIIMTGTAKECLEHFLCHGVPDEKGLAAFTKVNIRTVASWRLHNKLPKGETMLRLHFFLMSKGYSIDELKPLSKVLLDLGLCIVLDVVDVKDIQERLGYADTKRIFEYFRQTLTVTPSKLKIITSIVEEHSSELMLAIERFGLDEAQRTSVGVVDKSSGLSSFDEKLSNFESACKQVTDLGKELLDGPVEHRVRMREKMGTGPEPLLYVAWRTLNLLLREQTKYEPR